MSRSIFWHDYETWGVNPQKDVACQFAGIRTDEELNIIDRPVKWYCQIPNDYLPQPQAALVTGITPQLTLRDGLVEAEFIKKIHQQMTRPGTCSAGYNSIRFDDEVTRYTLYRNLYDPYAREWQNGNSRWDIIDLVRTCYALRPEGINWVYKDDGSPNFKLEVLSEANEISHADAHDALSDVYATIGLAKKLKEAQPKLFDYAFNLRSKNKVKALIDIEGFTPLVHISSKLPAIQGCCTWIVPVAWHPTNKNAVICLNLALDPSPLFDLEPSELKDKLYQPSSELAPGEQRLPIKLIHLNKCPILASAKTLTEDNAQRLGIDRKKCLENLTKIKRASSIQHKLINLFEEEQKTTTLDVDFALYSGGFFSDHDKKVMEQIRTASTKQLETETWQFDDSRLQTMLFRYKARNYPSTLNHEQVMQWQKHRQHRLADPESTASIGLDEYIMQIEQLSTEHQNNPEKQAILRALYQYAENL
ncbi:MAG: exodeoxyribonuclease I [Aliiglaciecola sp.]